MKSAVEKVVRLSGWLADLKRCNVPCNRRKNKK
jgi:hypothetical protein